MLGERAKATWEGVDQGKNKKLEVRVLDFRSTNTTDSTNSTGDKYRVGSTGGVLSARNNDQSLTLSKNQQNSSNRS